MCDFVYTYNMFMYVCGLCAHTLHCSSNLGGSFLCTCLEGFVGDGKRCAIETGTTSSPAQCTTAGGYVFVSFLCVLNVLHVYFV
jgi:hypothetical protein